MTRHKKNLAKKNRLPSNKPGTVLKSGRSIVPSETIAGNALVLVVAIMTFLACVTLGCVAMIANSALQWQSDIAREITIQIRPSDEKQMDDAIREASRIALDFPGVIKVTKFNDEAIAQLLEPWLGSGFQLEELPVPRLLTVTIADDATPDFTAMRKRIETEVHGASLDDHRAWINRLTRMAVTMITIGITIFVLMMIATITTIIFATRGAMAGNRDVVEILHFVGADGKFVSAQFQKHFFKLGLKGASAGGIIAIIMFVVLGLWSLLGLASPEGSQINALFGTVSPGLAGYGGMFAVIALVAVLTSMTSRWTVHRQIRILQDYNHIA